MAKQSIIINKDDNVAVALEPLKQGEEHEGVTLLNDIEKGHKFAVKDIAEGEQVIKYGNPIGKACVEIKAGALVHTANLKTNFGDNLGYSYEKTEVCTVEVKPRTVNVYRRDNGSVGIRNEIWIIPISGCLNGQARLIRDTFKNRLGTKGFDGLFSYVHPYGIGKKDVGAKNVRCLLQKLIRHPNAGGVLVLGLDGDGMFKFREELGYVDESRIKFLVCGDVEDEIENGVQLLSKIADTLRRDVREQVDISCLKVGVISSGADNMSAVTANPLVGMFADYLTSAGGTIAFAEMNEAFGTEQLLMNRAKDEEVYEKVLKLVKDNKEYLRGNGWTVYENPSPECKAGGTSTLEDRAIGFTQMTGNAEIADVVASGEIITQNGLNLIYSEGNDMCAVTSLAGAGCHMVLYTMGSGTPFGGCVPTIKISSNSELASKKSNWVDFDAGAVAEEGYSARLEKLTDFVTAVANGKLSKNEISNSRGIAISCSDFEL